MTPSPRRAASRAPAASPAGPTPPPNSSRPCLTRRLHTDLISKRPSAMPWVLRRGVYRLSHGAGVLRIAFASAGSLSLRAPPRVGAILAAGFVTCFTTPAFADEAAPATDNALATLCGIVDTAAKGEGLPVAFLTRLIWQESGFQPDVVGTDGADGSRNSCRTPATSAASSIRSIPWRQSRPPRRPSFRSRAAIRQSRPRRRRLQRGPKGLAIHRGPDRTSVPDGELCPEIVTGHTAEEWKGPNADKLTPESVFPNGSCEETVAAARAGSAGTLITASPFSAPWGVQISGSFSKGSALRAFARAQHDYYSVIGGMTPFVLGSVLRSRGTRPFYRVRLPAQTPSEAQKLCDRLQAVGGTCAVLRS